MLISAMHIKAELCNKDVNRGEAPRAKVVKETRSQTSKQQSGCFYNKNGDKNNSNKDLN